MASEQFSLCWDNFHKNMSSGMNSLLENEDLVDVTLAVEGKCLKAHKMVLSVCSPYFKELFKSNPCQHPIVFMKDVSYVALSDLLQFMYQGEVQVSQENLTTFIKTAEALQIKGLTGDGNGSADTDPIETPQERPVHQIEEYKPMPRPKKQPAAPVTTPSPSVKRSRLSVSSSDSQPLPPTVAKSEPVASAPTAGVSEPVQFKMEPYDQTQSLIDETGDDNFGDDNLDDTNADDTEDYSMMEGGACEEEPQAGTSTDGAGEGQEKVIPRYVNATFFEHFRLNRVAVAAIVKIFANSSFYKYHSELDRNISAHDQVFITLWYIGHETVNFIDVANRFNITLSTLNRIFNRVILCISNISSETIKWPTQTQRNISQEHFAANGFPGAFAAIGVTHIRINKPKSNADSYLNQKGFHSIQMQAVCDYRLKIIDVFIGRPGSVHESQVFRKSPLNQHLEEMCGDMFLLGDSVYPLKRNLMTPFKNTINLTRRHMNYNFAHARNRYVIEHTFEVLRQKFRQLYNTNLDSIPFTVHLIRATCVLHNIAIEGELNVKIVPPKQPPQPVSELPAQSLPECDEKDDYDDTAQEFRNNLVNTFPL